MSRYMMIMRVQDMGTAGLDTEVDLDAVIAEMGRYNEALFDAGVLRSGEGLAEPEDGFVVDFAGDPARVTDGAYPEPTALFSGYWIIETPSVTEAKEWAIKCPLGPGVRLEVRRVSETAEFDAQNPWVQREIQWKADLAEQAVLAARTAAGR
ncbi:YciI family protein [Mycolicibacterium bacteremicum]|uniref:YciI family protein n=1 Tax=Mycolicibacterium bacteremicum TaxID=564198 RepID=UPI0026ED7D11|nr:YciI family protein [Mycolicibacterium bacteremicum]